MKLRNRLVIGDKTSEVRLRHQGNVVDDIIAGAYDVFDGFDLIREVKDGTGSMQLDREEQTALPEAALAYRYDITVAPAPITADQVLRPRRAADTGNDLWSTFNRVQESLIRGGLPARTANGSRTHTREVTGIDQDVKLNRALYVLADALRARKS